MSERKILDIIKKAILLEHRGKALYTQGCPENASKDLKELFELLAEEEESHIMILNNQYNAVAHGGGVQKLDIEPHDSIKDEVLSEKIVNSIKGVGVEASLISAALDFEQKAVAYYKKQLDEAQTEEEKTLFRWFVDWEQEHQAMLARIDKELMEKVWYDNNFWAF